MRVVSRGTKKPLVVRKSLCFLVSCTEFVDLLCINNKATASYHLKHRINFHIQLVTMARKGLDGIRGAYSVSD